MLPSAALLAMLLVAQDAATGSVTLRMDLPFGLPTAQWRVEMELELPAGNRGVGKRTPDAEGVVRFDAVPVGVGTISLRWLQPAHRRQPWSDGLVIRSQPIKILAGGAQDLNWSLEPSLVLASVQVEDPSGRADEDDFALLIASPESYAEGDIDGELSIRSFGAAMSLPVVIGSEVILVNMGGSVFSTRCYVPTWRVPSRGQHEFTFTIPDGRIEVQLIGSPPHGDKHWFNTFVSLETDPCWRPALLPVTARVSREGLAIFDHVPAGDYFVRLEWSDDGDDLFTQMLFQRWTRFEGGARSITFATSGVGAAELSLPPGLGRRIVLTRDSDAIEIRELPWPTDGRATVRAEDLPLGRWEILAEGEGVESRAHLEIEPGRTSAVALPRWRTRIPVRLLVEGREGEEGFGFWLLDSADHAVRVWDPSTEGQWEGNLPPGRARVVVPELFGGRREASFEVPEVLPEGTEMLEFALELVRIP